MAVRPRGKSPSVLGKIDRVIAAAGKDPLLAAFARELFAGAGSDDLEPFESDELADLARDALGFLRTRQRGRHQIRLVNPADDNGGARRSYTLIEIANDDMPFLVESILSELADRGIEVHLLLHPVLWVARGSNGALAQVLGSAASAGKKAARESFIHMHIDRIASDADRAELEASFVKILSDVRIVVLDWRQMRARLEAAIAGYQSNPPPVPIDELAETIDFLQWLAQDHFTFLGIREFMFEGEANSGDLIEIKDSGLGALRDPSVRVLRRGTELVSMTPEVREFLMQPSPLIVTKANVKAHVHRRSYMDYIGVKQFDETGAVKGELRIVGLFTSAAYNRAARNIPFLRRKVDLVLDRAGFDTSSHSGRALINVLESYPRDELFQTDIDTLVEFSLGILQLAERPRTRIFVRYDKFDRFVSVLAYVPRDSYDTSVRVRIGEHLAETFNGRLSAFYPAYPEGTLARVHFIIGRFSGSLPKIDLAALEKSVAAIARRWDENLKSALEAVHRAGEAHALCACYQTGFSSAYQEFFEPNQAISDIAKMESLTSEAALALDLESSENGNGGDVHLKLYHLDQPIALSDRLPILENMGFRAINERSYQIERAGGDGRECVWLHDIVLETDDRTKIDSDAVHRLIEDAFLGVWQNRTEDDGYNRLIRLIGVPWREVSVLRAIGKYLQQAGIPFSQDYMAATLGRHSAIAARLIELFRLRFDPQLAGSRKEREKRSESIVAAIERALNAVSVLDEDRIIRRFVNVIQAGLRTNYYQSDGDSQPRPAIALKLKSDAVEGLPKPRPFAEIFVYSPRVEGVHLRGGRIARGGLRWSDRPQDFRTEILGLAKAQQVKNAVIVPVGSKGGFVPKCLPRGGSREEVLAEGIACYKIFISSLLDVTDNLVDDAVAAPDQVIRYDGDDPYLVVAADKGTATFSDIANEISTAREFWLGDAFASGGSAGYDHKKMGITARGAWEAVKRHFRELDRDIQTEPFTVVGCGDMSGDVFGNGMLLSKQIKLIAAFDHRDIFIDPDPNPATSWTERRRLFRLDRSSWNDYDPALISAGGGVFSRQTKSIRLTKEIKQLTGLGVDRVTPVELIRALLMAPVDLLWFGGIGTYVRASDETDDAVGDRANDALRITGREVAAKVIGEGANLGLTQHGRIEFARAGGRLNTDAIDNSAGVNTSDVEVNIKIALASAIKSSVLKSGDRNRILSAMTNEVAQLVLRNNYEQTLCVSLAESRGGADLGFQIRLMKDLESRELLDRAVEDLPDDVELADREQAGEGLTRPELAVLLAYGKIALFGDILDSQVPDDAYLGRELISYFPESMHDRFASSVAGHRLRREIIATRLSNSIINRGGSTMIQRLIDETGADVAEIVSAFTLTRDAYGLEGLLDEIDALDTKIANAVQTALYVEVQNLIRRQTVWFLRHADIAGGLEPAVAHFRKGVDTVAGVLDTVLSDDLVDRADRHQADLVGAGVPKKLARRIATLPMLQSAADIVLIADASGKTIDTAARLFFLLGGAIGIDWLMERAQTTSVPDYYDRLALNRVVESISAAQRRIAIEAFAQTKGKTALESWLKQNARAVERARSAVAELADSSVVTLSKLSVASAYMHDLAQG